MAAIGALILLEKNCAIRQVDLQAIGAVFVVVGVIVMLFPDALSRLSSQVVL
jgi:hypothetical protein